MEGSASAAGGHSAAAWRVPLIAGAVTVAFLIVVFLALAPFLIRPAPPQPDSRPAEINALLSAGRTALTESDFHLAAKNLQTVLDEDQKRPGVLSSEERLDATQLYRQSDLLSRLSSRSLQEMVQEADLVRHESEWKARFDNDYKDKTILFDDMVHFDNTAHADGRRSPVLAHYRVRVNGKDVHLALSDLNALQTLPLERGRRLFFGGRLSAVERGPGGQWEVHFDPESGVLLTDRGAAEAVCPEPLDNDLLAVLKQQEEWLRRTAP